ncbi:hypothetical protein KZZ08_00575 [Roseovarius mucosus]|uniref:hypothetical protein n=1 Tax=Roseovarius mucosus TaxID=215743 RepID=UPI001C6059FA|nr:hypothetical protein [Roseovarius mucosus]MBW4972090.1 hypothetical protein [Roseovarius mucosus]
MQRQCKTCLHYGESGSGVPGYCLWAAALPPVLQELLAALEADPGTSIAYTVFSKMEFSVDETDCCSAWTTD